MYCMNIKYFKMDFNINFKVWYPGCDSETHNKRKYNPKMNNFTTEIVNDSYMFRLQKIAIISCIYQKYKKEIVCL
jgi:hypothetical protein